MLGNRLLTLNIMLGKIYSQLPIIKNNPFPGDCFCFVRFYGIMYPKKRNKNQNELHYLALFPGNKKTSRDLEKLPGIHLVVLRRLPAFSDALFLLEKRYFPRGPAGTASGSLDAIFAGK